MPLVSDNLVSVLLVGAPLPRIKTRVDQKKVARGLQTEATETMVRESVGITVPRIFDSINDTRAVLPDARMCAHRAGIRTAARKERTAFLG